MNLQQRFDERQASLEQAKNSQGSLRLEAIDALGKGGYADLEVLLFLRAGLVATNAGEGMACVRALYRLQEDICLPWIIEALPSMPRNVARDAAHWLTEQGHRGKRELARLLDHKEDTLFAMISVLLFEEAPDMVADWCKRRLPQQDEARAQRALNLAVYLLEDGWQKANKSKRRQHRNDMLLLLLRQKDHANETIREAVAKALKEAKDQDPLFVAAFRLPSMDAQEKLGVLGMLESKGREQHADCIEPLIDETNEEVFLAAFRVICKIDPSRRHKWFERCVQTTASSRFLTAISITKAANDPEVWNDLLQAPALWGGMERIESIKALCEVFPRYNNAARKTGFVEILRRFASDPTDGVRETIFPQLARMATPAEESLLMAGISDTTATVREHALRGLQQSNPEKAWESAIALCRDGALTVKCAAYGVLLHDVARCPNKIFLQACREEDATLQQRAASGISRLPEGMFRRLIGPLLTTRSETVQATLERMASLCEKDEQLALLRKGLLQAHPSGISAICEALFEQSPQPWTDLEEALPNMRPVVRAALVAVLRLDASEQAHQMLRHLLKDADAEVRRCALEALQEKSREEAMGAALTMRDDENAAIRLAAIQLLRTQTSDATLALLLPMARDEDASVRREALDALSAYDDPEVLSELVSSVNDVDEDIKTFAKELLQRNAEAVPALRHAHRRSFFWDDSDLPAGMPVWERLHQQVDEVRMWASRIGQLLLGAPVLVHQYRQGLGRTWRRSKDGVVEIELSDTPITQGHPFGEEIVKGLALHEIGHHLYDFGVRGFPTVRGIARSEGLGQLFDVLIDERLERRLRSRRPMWGIYFDRLASYAFAQRWHRLPLQELATFLERSVEEVREDIANGILPGILVEAGEVLTENRMMARFFGGFRNRRIEDLRIANADSVLLRDSDLLRIPDALAPETAFLWCLRCGFDPTISPDPRIAQAIALVQGEFRHLEHAEILQLARDITAILGHAEDPCCKEQRQRRRQKLSGLGHLRSIMQRVKHRMREVGTLPSQGQKIRGCGIRKQAREIIYERKPSGEKGEGGQTLHLGAQLDFPLLDQIQKFDRNATEQTVLCKKVRPFVRLMRAYFERLGRKNVDEYASRRGRRLDMGQIRNACVRPHLNVLVHSEEIHTADLYIGLLIDRSGSMSGDKLESAKAFGTLLCESAKGLRGIQGHVHAFDDNTWYPLGDFESNNIASLSSGGANNDAGALLRAAELALQSKKRQKLLIMISDGSPTECSVESLKKLVEILGREHGILCAQAAVEALPEIAFPHYVDLSQYRFGDAVQRFGKLLIRLTQHAA